MSDEEFDLENLDLYPEDEDPATSTSADDDDDDWLDDPELDEDPLEIELDGIDEDEA